jgi:hypothetical protein
MPLHAMIPQGKICVQPRDKLGAQKAEGRKTDDMGCSRKFK